MIDYEQATAFSWFSGALDRGQEINLRHVFCSLKKSFTKN